MKRYYTTNQAAQAIAERLNGTQEGAAVRGWVTRICAAILKGELVGVHQGKEIDPDSPGSAVAAAVGNIRADDLNTWLDSIRCPVEIDEQVELTAKANSAPVSTQNNTHEESYDWKAEALKIANVIGQKKYDSGVREITARNIAKAVAEELEKDSRSHGQRGPRASETIRKEALKSWKFSSRDSGASGARWAG